MNKNNWIDERILNRILEACALKNYKTDVINFLGYNIYRYTCWQCFNENSNEFEFKRTDGACYILQIAKDYVYFFPQIIPSFQSDEEAIFFRISKEGITCLKLINNGFFIEKYDVINHSIITKCFDGYDKKYLGFSAYRSMEEVIQKVEKEINKKDLRPTLEIFNKQETNSLSLIDCGFPSSYNLVAEAECIQGNAFYADYYRFMVQQNLYPSLFNAYNRQRSVSKKCQ